MSVRVGINGFGRIGRDYLRCVLDRASSGIEVVAINDVAAPATLAHLLRHDSTYGPLKVEVGHTDDTITVGGRTLRATAERDPARLDWAVVDAEIRRIADLGVRLELGRAVTDLGSALSEFDAVFLAVGAHRTAGRHPGRRLRAHRRRGLDAGRPGEGRAAAARSSGRGVRRWQHGHGRRTDRATTRCL